MDSQGAATFDELFETFCEQNLKELMRVELKHKPGDPDSDYQLVKFQYELCSRYSQLRSIQKQLNKGFVDKETGEIIEGCTPYALQRAKHNLKLISDEAGHNKAIADKVKSTFPLEDWDNFKGDSFEKIDKWIEENNIRPRKPTKNENFA